MGLSQSKLQCVFVVIKEHVTAKVWQPSSMAQRNKTFLVYYFDPFNVGLGLFMGFVDSKI